MMGRMFSGPCPSRRALKRPPQGEGLVPRPEERPKAASRRMGLLEKAAFAFTAVILCGTSAHAETDYAGIARHALGEVIHPGYTALAETTGSLSTKVQALCQQP